MKNPKFISRFTQYARNHKLELIILLLIILLASFLRLYKIRESVVFLGDEGRDALVVKRILYDGKLTLLGPTASVGGFYLGPIYYYFMIPFMILSGMDPVGPAIMIAFMGILTVALLYCFTRELFGKFSATIVAILYTLSPGIVNFSRSSWNPNPMPLFTLLAITSIYHSIKTKKFIYSAISGISLGVIIQLHYLGLLVGPILAAIILATDKPKYYFRHLLNLSGGFLLGASLYFAFEIRHGFPNVRSVIEFIGRFGNTTGPRSYNFIYLFNDINRFNTESILSNSLQHLTDPVNKAFLFLVLIYLSFILLRKQKLSKAAITALLYWFVGIVGISFYKGQLHYHYFEFLFPAPFLVLGLIISKLSKLQYKLLISVITLVISAYLLFNQSIWSQRSNLIEQTKNAAFQVARLADHKPFNFALITAGNSDHAYRFFLEIANEPIMALEEQVTDQLIIVCEQEIDDCNPLGHPLWEIAGFGRAEIDQLYTIQANLHIFRMTHHLDSIDRIGKPAPR